MKSSDPASAFGRPVALSWSVGEVFAVPIRRGGHARRPPGLQWLGARDRSRLGRLTRLRRPGTVPLAALAVLVLAGCSAPAVRHQRLVSRPNMTFSESTAFTYNAPRLLPQMAPGFPGGDASQNSGCSSCR